MDFRVKITGNDWWEKRIYYLTHGGMEQTAVMPALKKLNEKLTATLAVLFKPSRGAGKTYEHGYTGRYLKNLHSLVTPDTLKIVEGISTGGQEIREGGRPGSRNEIIEWAEEKLGVRNFEAIRIANKLLRVGRIGTGNSPLKQEHPVGAGKFLYPEWIVTIKNKEDIDRASKNVDTMIVRYLN